MSTRAMLLAPLAVAAALGAGCSGGDTGETAEGSIGASLTDSSIELDATSARAGRVSFRISNDGSSVHEFEVLRTDTAADALPVDSGVVQTTAAGIEIVDEVEDISPGTDAQLALELGAGSYAVICNVSGHYEAGMFASLDVS